MITQVKQIAMINMYKCFRSLNALLEVKNCIQNFRPIHTSAISSLKEIHVKETDDKVTTVEGVYVKSPREAVLVKTGHEHQKVCPLCALNLNLKHTDVLILSQFLRLDGCMLPKRITGLCNRQQKIVTDLVAMAQKAGLMPNLNPHYSKKDPTQRYGSRKLNRYFDETTLRLYSAKHYKREKKYHPQYQLYLQKYRLKNFK